MMLAPAIDANWIWLVGGVLLCAAEALAPGVFLIWIGLAALATGALGFVAAPALEWRLLIFCAFAAAAVAIGRRLYGSADAGGAHPFLNRRAEALVGRTVVLASALENGEGRARVDDTVWRVRGSDAPAGAHVRIVGVAEAGVLRVEPTEQPSPSRDGGAT